MAFTIGPKLLFVTHEAFEFVTKPNLHRSTPSINEQKTVTQHLIKKIDTHRVELLDYDTLTRF